MKIIYLISLVIILSGCSKTSPIRVETTEREIPVFHPPLPEGIRMLPIKWVVYTPERMKKYLEDLKKGNAPKIIFYGISVKHYENMSQNTSEIVRYIKSQKAVINYYRKSLKVNVKVDKKKAGK